MADLPSSIDIVGEAPRTNDELLLVFPTMGVGRDPLYWGQILRRVAAYGKHVRVVVGQELDPAKLEGCAVSPPLKIRSVFGVGVPSFKQIYREVSQSRGVCIVNEFGLTTVFSLLVCALTGSARTVLLVENHALYLRRYGVMRQGLLLFTRRLIARWASIVLTNNEMGRTYVSEILRVPSSKTIVGPYLTSVLSHSNTALARPLQHDAAPLKMATVGQLIVRKGFDILFRELASLPSGKLERISLSIFGNGPETAVLKALAAQLGLEHRVTFEGTVPYETLGNRLAEFNCFVLPTRADYRSLASFEAISLGLPLLVSIHDGAISDVLEEGVNGFSFDPERQGELARAVEKMMAALDQGRPLAAESRRIASKFTVDRAARILISASERATERVGDDQAGDRIAKPIAKP